ncbi:dTMP kinase [Stenotrophomonas sp. ISL-67]|uniref:dTMP kinase n=1 Tax=Stenotrophomonas sp. ISL-67 TaxID=2819171 RepID=UPI001BE9D294|nr:dTMP kinase [Stenotrophomonas sp. ISL-67]MBT2766131.1 dTMP kinase [Stenotrophomonas sp. ISL-67]
MSPALRRHPRFISLEGGEGAGKTTALNAIRSALQAQGHEVVLTREPGGTPLAERIRALLLTPDAEIAAEPLSAEAELLLVFAARAQHVRQVIEPALRRGCFVLSDRFTDSSYAYQGGGRGLEPAWIADLERRAVGLLPGLTLLLDVDVAVGRARANGRDLWPDRIESEQDDFFQRVRAVFRERATQDPTRFRLIDASQDQAGVAAQVVAAIDAWLAQEPGND